MIQPINRNNSKFPSQAGAAETVMTGGKNTAVQAEHKQAEHKADLPGIETVRVADSDVQTPPQGEMKCVDIDLDSFRSYTDLISSLMNSYNRQFQKICAQMTAMMDADEEFVVHKSLAKPFAGKSGKGDNGKSKTAGSPAPGTASAANAPNVPGSSAAINPASGKTSAPSPDEDIYAVAVYPENRAAILLIDDCFSEFDWFGESEVIEPVPGLSNLYMTYDRKAVGEENGHTYLAGPAVVFRLDKEDNLVPASISDLVAVCSTFGGMKAVLTDDKTGESRRIFLFD